MLKNAMIAALSLSLAAPALAQIGSMIPDSRLPIVNPSPRTVEWQDAGYFRQLGGAPIGYSLRIDVTTLGAVGDGVTDSTAAFQNAISQAAIESANGGFTVIEVPAGTYRLSASLNLASNMVLKGAGAGATVLDSRLSTGNYIRIVNQTNTGVEDLKVVTDSSNDKNSFTGCFIVFENTVDGYIRGVETYKVPRNHVRLVNSHNIEVSGCYFHEGLDYGGGGNGYGVEMDLGSTLCLVENNVFRSLRHSMILQNDCHYNVYAYNYSDDPYRDEWPHNWASDIALHGHWDAKRGGPFLNLFEGNRCDFIMPDGSHEENGNYNLFFRNHSDFLGIRIDGATDNQTMVNNYFRCPDWGYARAGYPYVIGGGGHYSQNNRLSKKNFWGSMKTSWVNQNSSFFNDVSYYQTSKPGFFGSNSWPHEAYAHSNPAEQRGFTTVTAGWDGYVDLTQ